MKTTFDQMGIAMPILEALENMGFVAPTPIQQQSIPLIMDGKDMIGSAETGTGKTAAFVIPLLNQLLSSPSEGKRSPRILVMAPTRELAQQVSNNFDDLGKKIKFYKTTIYGGVHQKNQVFGLKKGVDVIVATPGRLLDLVNQGHVDLSQIEHLVLDEADQMLDMGFINDLKKIIALTPENRQTILFSATVDKRVKEISAKFMQEPSIVSTKADNKAAETVEQKMYYVERDNKKSLLLQIIEDTGDDQALIFTRTKRDADRLSRDLQKKGYKSDAIHGDKTQAKRQRALKSFKEGKVQMLIATDVASRGLDIKALPIVVNYNLPETPEVYIHRIGRTGRAGMEGLAISLCDMEEALLCRDIKREIGAKLEDCAEHEYFTEKASSILQKTEPRQRSNGRSNSGGNRNGNSGGGRSRSNGFNSGKGHSEKRGKFSNEGLPRERREDKGKRNDGGRKRRRFHKES